MQRRTNMSKKIRVTPCLSVSHFQKSVLSTLQFNMDEMVVQSQVELYSAKGASPHNFRTNPTHLRKPVASIFMRVLND